MAREMKDSGVAWIGEIPSDWKLSKIGSLYSQRIEKVSDKDYPPLSVTMKGILPQLVTAAKSDDGDNRKLVRIGDFAINSRSDRRGSCGVSLYDGSVSPINIILTPRNTMNSGYYDWLFHTSLFADEFYKWGHGIVDDLWTTRWQEMKSIIVPVPNLHEQERIAHFLNQRCAEIDTVLDKTRTSIEEYKKLKQAIITQAVTKGIRGDRPMKESGVIWLDTVPAEWTISKIKYTIFPKEKPVLPMDEVITCFRDGTVTLRRNRREEGFTISFTENGYQGVDVGDLVIHGMDTFAGAIGCSDSRGKTSPVVHVCSTVGNNRYFMYFLRYMAYSGVLMDFSNGVRIRSSDFRNFKKLAVFEMLVPPLREQNKIVDYLDSTLAKIDQVIKQKEILISELEACKKSAIYEYVTGKREVPNAY